MRRGPAAFGFLMALCAGSIFLDMLPAQAADYGLPSRVVTKRFLRMPANANGPLPARLSQTGAFRDVARLFPASGLVPYELIVPFWSDGARKSRLVAVPRGKIGFAPDGEWSFPKGTVFVKTFELPLDGRDPSVRRRLETRLLVVDAEGGVYGAVYKWRADNSDADLLAGSQTEEIKVTDAIGEQHSQSWYYPSREDCLSCHTTRAGGVLGVKTRQLNRDFSYPGGIVDNQLRTWNHIGLLSPSLDEARIVALPKLAASDDPSSNLENRARSYLDANCSHCHRPGGTVASFDARHETSLANQALVDGPVLIDQGIDRARVISPNDPWRSIAYLRVNTVGDMKMPPVARQTIDGQGATLLREWILSLPGRRVLDPPVVSPVGGNFSAPVEVTLASVEPGADIRFTLDGSAPDTSDARYERPIRITGPTVVRARAFKDGLTRSVIAQEIFVVGD